MENVNLHLLRINYPLLLDNSVYKSYDLMIFYSYNISHDVFNYRLKEAS